MNKNLNNFRLNFEPLKLDRRVGRFMPRNSLQKDMRGEVSLELFKAFIRQVINVGSIFSSYAWKRLKRRLRRFKTGKTVITIRLRWVLVALMMLNLWPQPKHIIYADPIAPALVAKQFQPIATHAETKLQPEQEVEAVEVVSLSNTPSIPASSGCVSGIVTGNFYEDYIIAHESGGRTCAENASGAYGLCQSLPASKMASAGADWQYNPTTQLAWCNSYAIATYGGWEQSYNFWVTHHYW